jgi:2-hydroxychromene-2-carboxylate isomerase
VPGNRSAQEDVHHMTEPTVKVYTDYKSPYAYLAKDFAYALERDTGARLGWLPYTLDIPAYLGSANVDAGGAVLEASRNAHQWRRVKYSEPVHVI